MATLPVTPTPQEIKSLVGDSAFSYWNSLCNEIDQLYDMERQWNDGGEMWEYECKYRRSGKTLCAFYAKQDLFGFMIIFGKEEREKIEAIRSNLSEHTVKIYDEATTYHDGKWVMFDEHTDINDIKLLMTIKRKPNK